MVWEDLVVDEAHEHGGLRTAQTQRSSQGSFLRAEQLGAPGKLKKEVPEALV